jgi:UDP-N-acetylmuramoyl-L-alanyl-D-glutamate--2,6-diaminopimelate ligase
MKQLLKKYTPRRVLTVIRTLFHSLRAWIAAARYGFPAKKLHIIAITGTKGKTSTTVMTGQLLQHCGVRTGYISTAQMSDGVTTIANPYHMTTIDPSKMQHYLAQMVKNGCTHAVLEMSSQGLEQGRHQGLFGVTIAVFLNLFPEHIEAHGSWEKYAAAKAILFRILRKKGTAIVNAHAQKADYMLSQVPAYAQGYTVDPRQGYRVITVPLQRYKTIEIEGVLYNTPFVASFELENMYIAVKVAQLALDQSHSTRMVLDTWNPRVLDALRLLTGIPGRMEAVVESTEIDIMVDYAHEPESMRQLLQALSQWKHDGVYTDIVHVVSCDGAGRDDWKKPIMGGISYQYADYSVFTTDNWEKGDDPQQIVDLLTKDIAPPLVHGVQVVDRAEACEAALQWAVEHPASGKKILIVSTGVGNEHGLTRPDGRIDWDEKAVWQRLALTISR